MEAVSWITGCYSFLSTIYFIKLFREGESYKRPLSWLEWTLMLPVLFFGLLLGCYIRLERAAKQLKS
ncbi:hypothetical protein VIBNIFTn2_120112 [Vibrio nigripulchritudo FTn2]|nr:hypothetical protein VIBNIFTn2_120112 [Vibrio nigripulchritudo FTn2]